MTNNDVPSGFLIDEYSQNKKGQILKSNDSIYHCVLNQTSINENKNKFYIMQLIKNGSCIYHLIRYGRIGEPGKVSETAFKLEASAINAFVKQFRTKTKNKWGDDFIKYDGKYFLTEFSYEKELKKVKKQTKKISVKKIESKLEKRIQWLLELLSDKIMMQESLVQLEIDTKKMPLGKIKQSQLNDAIKLLKEVKKEITKYNRQKNTDTDKKQFYNSLVKLSDKYYTYVPYSCGRKKPPVIDTLDRLNKLNDILEELTNIAITTKIMEQSENTSTNTFDLVYKEINTEIKPVEMGSREWNLLSDFVINTHAPTHSFKLKPLDFYKITRSGEKDIYDKYCKNIQNRQILVHGSRMSNWVSILQNGLMLDPSRLGVVITGKMFGYGVYFANSISKSAQYCGSGYGTQKICLALAEVALGDESKRINADFKLSDKTMKKEGKNSCWGLGQMTPQTYELIDGAELPVGKLVKSNIPGAYLRYDEKIVYDVRQFYLKYLMILEYKV